MLTVFPNVILPHIHISPHSVTTLYIYLHTLKSINCIVNCNIVPHLFFPHVTLLSILYIHLQILKHINCIIKYNIVPSFYCPHVILLIILHIHKL